MSSTWRRALPGVANSLKVAFQGFCLGNLISNHMFEIRPSSGSSMLPTLLPKGDYLLLVKLDLLHAWRSASFPALMGQSEIDQSFTALQSSTKPGKGYADSLKSLKRGELVVAAHPIDPEKWVCKRIIGLPGDTVLVEPRCIKVDNGTSSPLTIRTHAQAQTQASDPLIDHTLRDILPRDLQELLALGNKSSEMEAALHQHRADGTGGEAPLQSIARDKSPWEEALSHHLSTFSTRKAPPALTAFNVRPNSNDESQSSNASLLSKQIASPSHPPPQYVTIPAGHVWLAGDNTSSSSDSRYYGPVPIALIKGSVVARAFPSPKWMRSTSALKWMD
ncbi:related to imp1-mitochondrial [Ceraceosorus bombacis]|uniref:Related to imp1-mitochondrial n=1 Tax=Ceraceosorus bombacis TaxID=401625 RepID=A0A0P1BJY5_9BASI|nr:related to imp1-mitochondrial [Ceraceosorus bombacis]